ncbi:MAG: M20 family metallopeptidase [Lachnospiraceae bacterium]|nr:M20 family metallopeptidase [Lachnospiraceae bacterium]
MEQIEEKIVDMLSAFIAIPSVNPGDRPESASGLYGEGPYVDWVEKLGIQLGYSVGRKEILPGRPNLFLSTGPQRAGEGILLFQTHSDVVEPGNMAEAFRARVEEGRIYGRGSCDAKGQLCAMLLGIELARRAVGELPREIWIALCCDEEHKHRGVDDFVLDAPRICAAIVGEPTELHLAAGCKGSIRFVIRTTGQTAHTSSPENGKNAIYLMAKIVSNLEQTAVPYMERRRDELCGRASVAVSLIQGGSCVNAVPDACEIHVDARLIPGMNWQETYEKLKGIACLGLGEPERERVIFEKPYLIDPSYRSWENPAMEEAFLQAMRNNHLPDSLGGVSFGCDASKLARLQAPVYIFGPGSIRQAHTEEEFISIQEIRQAACVYRDFILNLG